MSVFNQIYASYSNKNEELKNKAIAYGNSSYILINEENPKYINKYYIDGYTIYGEKHIQHIDYAYGFKNEISMYIYSNKDNLSYVPRMLSYDNSKVFITIEYLEDYITLKDCLDMCINSNYEEQKLIFKSLINLLNNMKNDNFVHNNLSLNNIMINLENMDIKIIDLKSAYIFDPLIHKDHSIFVYTQNDILFQIYKYMYNDKDLFMDYFKFKNPDYYLNENNKVGDFYKIGLNQLFDEHINFLNKFKNNDLKNYVESIIHFNTYVYIMSME